MSQTNVNFQSSENSKPQMNSDVQFLKEALNHGDMSEEMKNILLLLSHDIGKGFYKLAENTLDFSRADESAAVQA